MPVDIPFFPTDPVPGRTPEENATLAANATALVMTGFEHGVGPAEALGLPQDYLDAMHELAKRYYDTQRYLEASQLFRRLLQIDPMGVAHMKGLGACFLGLERYADAEQTYALASVHAALDPEVNYYLGLAHYHQKKYEQAFDILRFARVLAEENPRPGSPFEVWATQLLERLQTLVPPAQAALMDKRPA